MNKDIKKYNEKLSKNDRLICNLLCEEIDKNLKDAQSKIWHGNPVWFIEDNPIVGYAKLKDSIQLLFWSGRTFEEEGLENEGSFQASQIKYKDINDVNTMDLKRWLEKSINIQWDYKNIVSRKGVLERLK